MPNKIKCPKCGHMNEPGKSHCSNCGYKLDSTKEASTTSFMQSMYKTAMACPRAAGDVDLNTKNRDKTIQKHNYGPLNLNDQGYWELIADKWNTTPEVAKKSKCGNCVAFDVSPRMDDCMPGPVSDGEGRLGYCWMHHFKCHSARTCNTWAKGGPIKKDEASHDWQKKSKGMDKEASEGSSVKSDILKAFKAEGGALGMRALKKHVKAPDVQSRLKDLMEEGRVYKHRHGDFIEKEAASGEYDDSHMLSKILMRMSAQSAHLKEKIDAGLILPSWAEYKLYNAYSSLGSALGTAYPGEYHKEAKMLPGDFSGATHAWDRLGQIRKAAALRGASSSRSAVLNTKSKPGSNFSERMEKIMGKYNESMANLKTLHNKTAAATATKTDPAKWEAAKQEAKAKMGGKHSARAMQLATQIYKKKGGGYSGAKPTSSTNSLKKWTKQDWGYSGKDKPGQGGSGVYLPKRRRDALKATKQGRSMLASATRKKHKATEKGQQYSSHGLAAGTSLKKSASSSSRVVSPHAYYRPPGIMATPPMPEMNHGNSDTVNQQSQNAQMAQAQTHQSMLNPPAPSPSIQQNVSVTRPPPPPKLTGM